MKEALLSYLQCPSCAGALSVRADTREQAEIMTGQLGCAGCHAVFPITGGIPRFVDVAEVSADKQATANNFGQQWLEFDHVSDHHDQQFRDWIAPVTPDFVRGKLVVEGGCGKGRHTSVMAGWGAAAIIGVDLSQAVEAAFQNTRHLENAHIIQADIYRLPLRPVFDYGFSVGVLHHLPDPRGGFLSLAQKLRPGGAISAWIYGRENNGWIVYIINPLRKYITSKMPPRLLYFLSMIPSAILFAALRLVYAPLGGTALARQLFYADYLGYIARFPFREIHNIVHDHLTAPTAFYIRREEFAEWFREADTTDVSIAWHNRNSWRGFARAGAAGAERNYAPGAQ
ncbi:MAG: methyltransferase domain-containing protein [Blastocatellia bacterium]